MFLSVYISIEMSVKAADHYMGLVLIVETRFKYEISCGLKLLWISE